MPVTLSRRIRRIGLLPSTYVTNGKHTHRVHNFDPAVSEEDRKALADSFRQAAKLRRLEAFAKQDKQKPAKHRRSKSRRATQKKAA